MNRILKGLLITALLINTIHVNAYTGKTFLTPRSVGVDLPMESTTFNELAHYKGHERAGGTLAVTGFGKNTDSNTEMAKYFLALNKTSLTLSEGTNTIKTASDLDLRYIIHDAVTQANIGSLPATISLSPEQTVCGLRFDYYQDLSKHLKGLYLYANIPIAHIKNNLKLKVVSSAQYPANVLSAAGGESVQTTLINYFNGTFSNTNGKAEVAPIDLTPPFIILPLPNHVFASTNINLQDPLKSAKIDGNRSDTNAAEINVGVGYKFLNKESYHAALALAVAFPTGDEADGTYVFDAIVGNGDHFGIVADFCADTRIWGDINHNIKLNAAIKYYYLFENTEKRTLGIKGYNMGQYALLVKAGTAANQTTSLIPAANVTTLNLNITPGSQFDGILGLAYNNGNFTCDLGYNLYFRAAESLKLKDTFAAGGYAVAAVNANTTGGITYTATEDGAGLNYTITNPLASTIAITGSIHANGGPFPNGNIAVETAANGVAIPAPIVPAAYIDGGIINGASAILSTSNLDIDGASTPSQLTNSIYLSLGYIFKQSSIPVMLGLGGKYEWACKNSAFDQWTVYGKLGIGF